MFELTVPDLLHTVTNNLALDLFQKIGKQCTIEGNTYEYDHSESARYAIF